MKIKNLFIKLITNKMLGINLIRNIHVHKKKNTYNPQKHEEEDLDKQKCILFLSRKIQNYSTVSSSKMY